MNCAVCGTEILCMKDIQHRRKEIDSGMRKGFFYPRATPARPGVTSFWFDFHAQKKCYPFSTNKRRAFLFINKRYLLYIPVFSHT